MKLPTRGKIREILSSAIDWDYFLTEASENGVIPLVERQLKAIAPDIFPKAVEGELSAAVRANTVRCLSLTVELSNLLNSFEAEGIEVLPYKGPVLAVQAYRDVALRAFEDVDLILRQKDVSLAHGVLLKAGYSAEFSKLAEPRPGAAVIPGEYNYRSESRGSLVELHTEMTLRHFPEPLDIDDLTTRLQEVALAGHEMKTFSAEDTLILLSVHGAKDFWERLSWIADISELIQSDLPLNWDEVFERAEAMRTGRMLHVALALASSLLDAPLPEKIRRRVSSDQTAWRVAQDISKQFLAREPTQLDAAARFGFRRKMIAGRLAGFQYAVRLAAAPSEEDWSMIRLPGSLASLYPVLRPFRLLRKYGWARRTCR